MSIARIENGAVVERRDLQLSDVPEHKRGAWKPVVYLGDGPTETTLVESDRVSVTRSYTAPQIAALKSSLSLQVDLDAGEQRQRYMSRGAGIEMTYQEKHAQARAVIAMGEVAAGALTAQQAEAQFPTLAASVGIEAPTLWACAQLVAQRYELFADVSHDIEQTRLAGKKAIGEATTAAEAKAAYGAIQWPA